MADRRLANPAGINQYAPDPDGIRARRRQSIEFWSGKPVVYRFFDADGRLLYIGTSKCWPTRMIAHRQKSPWFADAARMTIKVYARSLDAYRVEADAIRAEQPLHNLRHTPRWIHPRYRTA